MAQHLSYGAAGAGGPGDPACSPLFNCLTAPDTLGLLRSVTAAWRTDVADKRAVAAAVGQQVQGAGGGGAAEDEGEGGGEEEGEGQVRGRYGCEDGGAGARVIWSGCAHARDVKSGIKAGAPK